MRRALAWVVYMLGLVLGLDVVVTGLAADGLWEGFGGIAAAVVLWWIVAGIGIRLGVTPQDFMASIVSALGFGDRPQAPTVPAEKKSRSETDAP
jgi:hypothetical protein